MSGKDYRVIAKTLGVSKSSVSNWCKDLKLPPESQKMIEEKVKAIKDKFAAYNRRKYQLVQAENREIKENAVKQISSLSKHDLFLVGTALYWAEGQNRGTMHRVKFVNSYPGMIALYLRFLREILQVPEEKIYPSIRVHPNINESSAISFWSKITSIPRSRFKITRQISRASKRKRPCNSLPHGTLELLVSKRQIFVKMKGWIDGLIKQGQKIGTHHFSAVPFYIF